MATVRDLFAHRRDAPRRATPGAAAQQPGRAVPRHPHRPFLALSGYSIIGSVALGLVMGVALTLAILVLWLVVRPRTVRPIED